MSTNSGRSMLSRITGGSNQQQQQQGGNDDGLPPGENVYPEFEVPGDTDDSIINEEQQTPPVDFADIMSGKVRFDENGNLVPADPNQQQQQQQQQQDPNQNQNQNQDDPMAELRQQLTQRLASGIQQIQVAEADIPEDFDPTDRGQLRTVMGKLLQQQATQVLNLSMQPLQMAMNQLGGQVEKYINDRFAEMSTNMRDSGEFDRIVPERKDPAMAPVVEALDAHMKRTAIGGDNPTTRAQLVRRALDAMGIKPQSAQPNRQQRGQSQRGQDDANVRHGQSALDMFSPLKRS